MSSPTTSRRRLSTIGSQRCRDELVCAMAAIIPGGRAAVKPRKARGGTTLFLRASQNYVLSSHRLNKGESSMKFLKGSIAAVAVAGLLAFASSASAQRHGHGGGWHGHGNWH